MRFSVRRKINRKEFDMSPAFADKKGLKIYFSSSRQESSGIGRDPITVKNTWIFMLRNLIKMATQQM